jgi:chemotaxis family two-component system sensor histidine kinase/response regulator PixL
MSDPTILEQGYNFFLAEAPELLERIEQDLYTLPKERTTAKVHNLMRAAHTLKGGAANVELDLIKDIAHHLEDIFRAFYKPELELDAELHNLLLEGYECLRTPLMAEISQSNVDPKEVQQRANEVFTKISAKMGDFLEGDNYIPSSAELGFDIAESIFKMGVAQRLEEIETVLATGDEAKIAEKLRTQIEVFTGLGESLGLPGFGAIAHTTLTALDQNPDQVTTIAKIALQDFQQGREAVLKGDRQEGGQPSAQLQQLAGKEASAQTVETSVTTNEFPPFVEELEAFGDFLDSKQLPPKVTQTYEEIAHCLLGWFHRDQGIPQVNLSFSVLIPTTVPTIDRLRYLETWLREFFAFLKTSQDRKNLIFFRQGTIIATVLSVAKFQYAESEDQQLLRVITTLQKQFQKVVHKAKPYPASASEKRWLESPRLQPLFIDPKPLTSQIPEEDLEFEEESVESIWGSDLDEETISTEETSTPEPTDLDLKDTPTTFSSESADYHLVKSAETAVETTAPFPPDAAEVIETRPTQNEPKAKPRQYIRVELESLERLNHLSGELLINHNRQALQEVQLKQAVQKIFTHLQRNHKTLNQLREWSELQGQNLGVPNFQSTVELSKFDSLELDQYSDLHLQLHSSLEELFQLQEAAESLDVIVRQNSYSLDKQQRLLASVRDDLLDARMIPLGNIINRFGQMVERMSSAYGKLVEFRIQGTEVLIDKAIAEKLYDPLLHLVRNAFDHGIEPPGVRQELGKPKKGLIAINAYYQGSQAIIEVRDDGKGLNMERIVSRANEMELLPAQQQALAGDSPSSSEVLDVLFQPGFSTSPRVTDISGRGIGLDIVRSQIHTLKGSISVQSSPQRGTTFVLQIPFSMTTAKLLVVQAGEAVYALLLDTIERILLPQIDQFKQLEGKKVLHWNFGDEKAVISVREFQELVEYHSPLSYNLSAGTSLPQLPGQKMSSEKSDQNPVCLLKGENQWLGLGVDAVLGDQEMVIRPLGSAIAPPKYVCGCSILGDGRLILVIDGAVLCQSKNPRHQTELVLPDASPKKQLAATKPTPLPPPPQRQLQPRRPYVMVVDDAVSLRQTLSLTLQKAGYQVIQAQDGLEALEKLKQNKSISAVICDLEMPRMNGFEFLSQVNQDPTLTSIPVAILTSRGAGKHRQLAEELGADAYFTKPFLEKELLDTVAELVKGGNNY